MQNHVHLWNLLWKGLAAGDRNGGPVRLATLLKQSLFHKEGFDEQHVFDSYANWFWNGGFDTGPTMSNVMFCTEEGLSIEEAVEKNHQNIPNGTAGIGPAHRSAPLLLFAKDEELVDLAMREAKLTHFDALSGRASAASLLICQYLLQGSSLEDIAHKIKECFGKEFLLDSEDLDNGGYAPRVIEASWYFLCHTKTFEEALQKSLEFAGKANYCPVLVGLWAACIYKEVPQNCLNHPLCPPNSNSVKRNWN